MNAIRMAPLDLGAACMSVTVRSQRTFITMRVTESIPESDFGVACLLVVSHGDQVPVKQGIKYCISLY
jgi:hypothetical protein